MSTAMLISERSCLAWRERLWEQAHADKLHRDAVRAMARWRRTLTEKQREELKEQTRWERVRQDIWNERDARRTVSMTVVADAECCATTGPYHSANLSPKGEAGIGGRVLSRSESSRQIVTRERHHTPSMTMPCATSAPTD